MILAGGATEINTGRKMKPATIQDLVKLYSEIMESIRRSDEKLLFDLRAIIEQSDTVIHTELRVLCRQIKRLMVMVSTGPTVIDELVAAVHAETTLSWSIAALVSELKYSIDSALSHIDIPDEVTSKIDSVYESILSDSARLANAVKSNTPANHIQV